jgi:glucose-6-phosphate isomerase, archaeal
MRHRVMSNGNGWELVDNTSYNPRIGEQVAALMKNYP